MTNNNPKIAVVISCYKVCNQILNVISRIGSELAKIHMIDECCPEGSRNFVKNKCQDHHISILYHEKNQGVGGTVIKGYTCTVQDGMEIIAKIDGDDQMNPGLLPESLHQRKRN